MFEKSLYDLIRGIRNHKGKEKEYIQNSLKECRVEIKGQDNDLKATALLKLIYLEMFGHDMSWASFHVLEVMSSSNYLQKRVGYLGAVQSFRSDTEVLMLATNLLKKDLTSTAIPTLSLPIAALPHIVTSSLALSTLQDLLPRMNHSDPAVRKKSIVTLYRLALVYPETLRPAWPKIKDRLMDEEEDDSVTAAIVNVVCELGWRRPQDFLPLAPRLFELLVNGGNNWMAIKLIKLFATLTPLEPRLVRKLLPPLTSIINTTPAMSLLYECINGIIQGGIIDRHEENINSEKIATLCVSKLREMIMVEGDANLKFVALLAFNKIVISHPALIAQQEDVILECIDSPDLSIRLRALDLVVRMVNTNNLNPIVGRLVRQLKDSFLRNCENFIDQPRQMEMTTDFDDESSENIIQQQKISSETLIMPDDYKLNVIDRILDMCSSNNYGSMRDFDWYIDILVELIRYIPAPASVSVQSSYTNMSDSLVFRISKRIGNELRNVAVKVRAVRSQVIKAAELILISTSKTDFSPHLMVCGVLGPIGWIVGEFATHLVTPESTLTALLHFLEIPYNFNTLTTYLQAVPKIFSLIASDTQKVWTLERKTMISLLMSRIIYTFEPLTLHPDLEVQERAVEFSELLKLSVEASSNHEISNENFRQEAPLLLTQAIPSLFLGLELKSIAPDAQRNVPLLNELDLDQLINSNLRSLLEDTDMESFCEFEEKNFDFYYHVPPVSTLGISKTTTGNTLSEGHIQASNRSIGEGSLDPKVLEKRRAERMEKHKDDPFYIVPTNDKLSVSTPIHSIIRTTNGPDLDVNKIPILQLDLSRLTSSPSKLSTRDIISPRDRKIVEIAPDETLVATGISIAQSKYSELTQEVPQKSKEKSNPSLLQVDSSHIGTFSLDESLLNEPNDYNQDCEDEAQIVKAMKDVEMVRLEMLRANERIPTPQGVEGIAVIKKKKKKKKKKAPELT